jgi:hypothetical protein
LVGVGVQDRLRSAVAAGDCACFATENIATLLSIGTDLSRSVVTVMA